MKMTILLLFASFLPISLAQAQPARKPNVIFILVDDMGYADLSSYGSKDIRTPNIDRLAREGVRLLQAYSNGPVCTPTRAAFITGRYQQRAGLEWAFGPGLKEPGLPVEETSIARMLKNNGYATALMGKWHLGYKPEFSPNAHGFDEFFGILSGNVDHYSHKENNGEHDLREQDRETFVEGFLTDHIARRSVDFVKRQKEKPFFLYLAFNSVHWPFQRPNRPDMVRTRETWFDGTRADYIEMMQNIDSSVGQVLNTLDQMGIAKDTLVIFTSDNGGADYVGLPGLNAPYRGWKMTFFEGGIRTPFFAQWPARLPAGQRFHAPVAHVDIFATAAAAANAPLPSDRVIDGVDLVKLARGEAQGAPHEAIFWRSGDYRTILAGDWKLQASERPKRAWLFDLANDPTERNNLAQARPDKRAELEAILAAHEKQMVLPAWPSLIEGPIAVDRTLAEPRTEGEEYVYWAN